MSKPTVLDIPAELEQSKIYGGSLFTMLEVTDPKMEDVVEAPAQA